MLSDDANRYITLRRTLGYKLVKAERHLRAASLQRRAKPISAPNRFSPGWQGLLARLSRANGA